MSLSKMERLSEKDHRKYLSAPALNKINNEVYIEGNRSLSYNASGSYCSMNYSPDKNLKKERTKSFISFFSSNGSSTNEKAEFSSLKALDLDLKQRTWNSSFLSVHNAQSDIRNVNGSCKNEGTQISEVTLSMTQAHSVSRGPTDPDGSAGAPLATKNFETAELIQSSRSSKARQKKFHRHFKQVDIEEKLLNYYSCALVGDILLQGHLYITENFFAFYSNVFGYVTKLLIPMVDVLKISKEKTARIIPNAVGISTEDEKHVFGSLLSRDSTYKFMLQVWKAANSTNSTANMNPPPTIKTEMPSDEDSSVSSGNEEQSYISNLTSPASSDTLKNSRMRRITRALDVVKLPDFVEASNFRFTSKANDTSPVSDDLPRLLPNVKRKSIIVTSVEALNLKIYWRSFKVKTLLAVSLALLVFLLGSAGFLLYRIAIIQNHFNQLSVSPRGSDVYEDIIKWQSTSHSTSASKISEFLNTNLNQITKVRLSLEALSMLILPGNNNIEKSHLNSKWESANVKDRSGEREGEGN